MQRRLKLLPLALNLVLLASTSALAQQFRDPFYGSMPPLDDSSGGIGDRIIQHLIAAVLGALIGAFFSDKLKKFRRWLFLGLLALAAIAWTVTSPTGGNITFFLVGLVAAYVFLSVKQPKAKPEKLTTFGSAEWANLEHLLEHHLVGKSSKGFLLGFFEASGQQLPLHYAGDRHLLTVAPTRAGKGVSSIIPNALTYEGSMLLIDPKGENAMITAARRGHGDETRNIPGMGQAVHVVDPWGITGLPVSRFNPLDWLDPQDEDIIENAMMLADSMILPHEGSKEPFWDEEAKALLMGFLLYVALDDEEQGDRTLGRVRDIISMGKENLDNVLLQMQDNPHPIVYSTAQRTLSKDPKLQSNVLASLQAHTHFLDSPRIRESLRVSDFRFEDLKTSRMTVYLVLPADRIDTFSRWLRLLVQQALTVNARNIQITPDKPILFLLDEMGSALGRLTMVEQAFGLMAGFGMQLWGIVQDLSQLERIYGKGWETFIGNSGVLQYFGSRDRMTAEYFSKLCGVTTIEKFSFQRSIARAFSKTFSGKFNENTSTTSGDTYTSSSTIDVVQRQLAYPDELMVMKKNHQLLLVENFNPISGQKVTWYQDQKLMPLGVNLKK